ncbi:MAG: hypothetical protein HZA15_15565 [Nitrospirae bacterium]|nr:hypothetical protein [Nitrospirota bacterium]
MSDTTLIWLTNCPPSDHNFKSELKKADVATIRKAIEVWNKKAERKTAIKLLTARLRKLEKENV